MDDLTFDIPTPTIHIGDGVTAYVKRFVQPNEEGGYAVRIELAPGGCSGHKYFLTPLEDILEEDVIIEKEGVKFYLDGLLGDYFEGLQVVYSEDLNGSQITVANPNAGGSCACGTSVSL